MTIEVAELVLKQLSESERVKVCKRMLEGAELKKTKSEIKRSLFTQK